MHVNAHSKFSFRAMNPDYSYFTNLNILTVLPLFIDKVPATIPRKALY